MMMSSPVIRKKRSSERLNLKCDHQNCSFEAASVGSLKFHKRSHSNRDVDGKIPCLDKNCSKQFIKNYLMIDHHERDHLGYSYGCKHTECSANSAIRFGSRGTYLAHYRKSHGQRGTSVWLPVVYDANKRVARDGGPKKPSLRSNSKASVGITPVATSTPRKQLHLVSKLPRPQASPDSTTSKVGGLPQATFGDLTTFLTPTTSAVKPVHNGQKNIGLAPPQPSIIAKSSFREITLQATLNKLRVPKPMMDSLKCHFCPFLARGKGELIRHNKSHLSFTQDGKVACFNGNCDETFRKTGLMAEHYESVHLGFSFSCPLPDCNTGRHATRSRYTGHWRRRHSAIHTTPLPPIVHDMLHMAVDELDFGSTLQTGAASAEPNIDHQEQNISVSITGMMANLNEKLQSSSSSSLVGVLEPVPATFQQMDNGDRRTFAQLVPVQTASGDVQVGPSAAPEQRVYHQQQLPLTLNANAQDNVHYNGDQISPRTPSVFFQDNRVITTRSYLTNINGMNPQDCQVLVVPNAWLEGNRHLIILPF